MRIKKAVMTGVRGCAAGALAAAVMFGGAEARANLALGQPVTLDGAAPWPGLAPSRITDGNFGTFTHPNTPAGGVTSYLIDLGAPALLDQIDLYNRADGCCPDRLTKYTVSLHHDNGGMLGSEVFSASVRSDGTNSGVGGVDSVTAASGTGPMMGRWLQITGPSDVPYALQIAEVVAPGSYLTNFAAGAPVSASGPTWPGQPASFLTDGNFNTISHPTANQDNFQYTIDMGEVVDAFSINVHNRADCCPERLTQYTVSVHRDINGVAGDAVWSALVRGDGTNSGLGGYDTIQEALDAAGRFGGRFVRITGNTADYNPQIAEVEVFGTSSRLQTEAGLAYAGETGLAEASVREHRFTLGNAAAQSSQTSPLLLVGQAIDGNVASGGWGNGPSFANNVAVFETGSDVTYHGDGLLEFTMRFNSYGDHGLGKFRLSATTADRAMFADGVANGGQIGPDAIWTVLTDLVLFDSASGLELVGGDVDSEGWFLIDDVFNPSSDAYLMLMRTFLSGITGFRLEIMDDPSLTGGGPGLSNSNGNSVLTEFTAAVAWAVPAPGALPGGLALMALIATRRRRTHA